MKSTVLCAELVNLWKFAYKRMLYFPLWAHSLCSLLHWIKGYSTCFHSLLFLSASELVSDCHLVYQQTCEHKIFDLFVAQVVQKLYSGIGPFFHILCSFLHDHPEWSRQNKMLQMCVQKCQLIHTWQCWVMCTLSSFIDAKIGGFLWNPGIILYKRVQIQITSTILQLNLANEWKDLATFSCPTQLFITCFCGQGYGPVCTHFARCLISHLHT